MSAVLRRALTRLSPLCFLAASVLTVTCDAEQDTPLLGWVFICAALGTAGLISGTLTARASHDKALLLSALVANRPSGAAEAERHHRPDLHRVV